MSPPRLPGLGLLLVLALFGCSRVVSGPLAGEARASLGTVAVVPARFAPSIDNATPPKGALAGAGRGAAVGAGLGLAFGVIWGGGVLIATYGLAAGAALALLTGGPVVGTVIGTAYGAAKAQPAEVVADAEGVVRGALHEIPFQATLGDLVRESARARACHPLVEGDGGPREPGERVDYRGLAPASIRTVLEVSVLEVELDGSWTVDPELALVMSARARLVSVADGTRLYERRLEYRSKAQRFTDWAEAGGLPLRAERDRTLRAFAEQIVEDTLELRSGQPGACRG